MWLQNGAMEWVTHVGRGLVGVVAFIDPENPYQSTVSLWAVATFFGLLVLSSWIYLHWVWAGEHPGAAGEPPPASPRIVVVAAGYRTAQEGTAGGTVQGRTSPGVAGEAGGESIADLLVDDPEHLADTLHHRLVELALVADVLAELDEVGLGQGFDVVRQVAEELAAYLGQPLGGLVQASWHAHPDVQAACLGTVGRRGATRRVDVGHHVLEAVHRPIVELDVDGARTPLLDGVLSVTLTVDGLPIDIAQGEVVATGAGQASSSLSLSLAGPGGPSHVVLSEQNASLVLPAYRRPAPDDGSSGRGHVGTLAGGIPGARPSF